jgi:hypothetical protein
MIVTRGFGISQRIATRGYGAFSVEPVTPVTPGDGGGPTGYQARMKRLISEDDEIFELIASMHGTGMFN